VVVVYVCGGRGKGRRDDDVMITVKKNCSKNVDSSSAKAKSMHILKFTAKLIFPSLSPTT
jgi:hypothetical protein